MNRVIDTIDGDVLVKTAYDCDTDCSYLEFFVRDGYDEELFPWKFVGETPFSDDIDEMTDDELEQIYHNEI